ncbi:MT-A70 [Geosmithia morbida]|uniref:MT-A70 n=1 Tax=Geosmithia morbida TaxID=1094350 RepID=A0A9P4Z3G1_9HYPO|nr:MT-A70 [Geosmithia morbida]KAF4126538.1 MT-A70 [Geosmithia morbida]
MVVINVGPDPPTSCILYQTDDASTLVVDIPRSIEESQVPPGHVHSPARRLVSVQPPSVPYDTPEPRTPSALQFNKLPATQVAELMTAAAVQSALADLGSSYSGPLCLPRVVGSRDYPSLPAATDGGGEQPQPFMPEGAVALHGPLEQLNQQVRDEAPRFDLVVLDPPWPNRSARRRRGTGTDTGGPGYSTVRDLSAMRRLLLDHVPVPSHLRGNGLVAVWITNKASVLDFVTAPSTGLLASWELELVTEWTWLKVTTRGEPVYPVDSAWRKPWEKLLIAKRRGAPTPAGLGPRTIVAVPDVHSRKPNLRHLFSHVLQQRDLVGLDVFARNLTAGWWCWGDDVLQFQQAHHWKVDV